MTDQRLPRVGEIYLWAGKRWKVTALRPVGAGTLVDIHNVDRPLNTATLPASQFRTEATVDES